MAIFGRGENGGDMPIDKLRRNEAKDAAEQKLLIRQVFNDPKIKAKDIQWTLCAARAELRELGVQVIDRIGSVDWAKVIISELKDKSEAEQNNLMRTAAELDGEVVCSLIGTLLAASDQRRRRKGVYLLRHAALPKVKTLLSVLVKEGTGEAQVTAIGRLVDDPEALKAVGLAGDALVTMTEHADDSIRRAAYTVLASTGSKSAQLDAALVKGLSDSVYSIQQLSLDRVRRRIESGDAGVEVALIERLSDGRNDVRSAVVDALAKSPDMRRVVRAYLEFTKGLAGWVRDRALQSLKIFGDGLIDPVIQMMNDPDREIRLLALGVGASFEDKRCVAPIIGLLKDEDWWTRILAAETLGRIGDERAVDPLIEALADDEAQWSALEALGAIGDPKAIRPIARFLTHDAVEVRLSALRALAGFNDARVVKALGDRLKKDDSQVVRDRCVELLRDIAQRSGEDADLTELEAVARERGGAAASTRMERLLVEVRRRGGSDLHMAVGLPPQFRIRGELTRTDEDTLTEASVEELLKSVLTDRQLETLAADQQLDICYEVPNVGRYRANIFEQRLGLGGVFRVIPGVVPNFRDVGLPDHLTSMADQHQGLIVVAGPASSGKSTTLAAIVNLLNERKRAHILSVEEPVEFVHQMKQSLVNQREVGKHTQSFANALRGALREDPDVIIIGDMRDPEVIRMALEASETGHLVVGTMNTTSAHKTIDRLVESFPPNEQPQVRLGLSESLQAVICQRLLPALGGGLCACFEMLLATHAVRTMIRDNKTHQLPGAMQMGKSRGMRTRDMALEELVEQRKISAEDAYMRCEDKTRFEPLVSPEFLADVTTFAAPDPADAAAEGDS
jgi:twitching motility protein PilT